MYTKFNASFLIRVAASRLFTACDIRRVFRPRDGMFRRLEQKARLHEALRLIRT